VDRDLSWRETAIAMCSESELDEAAVEREAAKLRKRFERVKADLRKMAEEAGLLR
jgi:hypothetical protein